MALEDQTKSVLLAGGINQKVFEYLLDGTENPSLREANNVEYDKGGALQKRTGTDLIDKTGITTSANFPNGIFARQEDLCASMSDGVYVRSTEDSAWQATNASGVYPADIERRTIVAHERNVKDIDEAIVDGITGSYVCTVWSEDPIAGHVPATTGMWYMVREREAGTIVIPPTQVLTMGNDRPHVVTLDDRYFVVTCLNGTNLRSFAIDTNTNPLAAAADALMLANVDDYDVTSTTSETFGGLIQTNGGTTSVHTFDVTGAITASTASPGAAYDSDEGRTIFHSPTNSLFYCGVSDVAITNVRAFTVSEDTTVYGAVQNQFLRNPHGAIVPAVPAIPWATPVTADRITIAEAGSGMWICAGSTFIFGSPDTPCFLQFSDMTITAVQSGTVGIQYNHELCTKAFNVAGITRPVVGAFYRGLGSVPTLVPVNRLQTSTVGLLCTHYTDPMTPTTGAAGEKFRVIGRFQQDRVVVEGQESLSFLPNVVTDAIGLDFYFAKPASETITKNITTAGSDFSAGGFFGDEIHLAVVPLPVSTLESSRVAHSSGSYFGGFDGYMSFESTPHMPPLIRAIGTVGAAGSSIVSYQAVAVFTDAAGNKHRSAVSNQESFNTSSAIFPYTVQILLPPPSAVDGTYGRKLLFELYRTQANASGDTTLYLLSTIDPDSDVTATGEPWAVTFTDAGAGAPTGFPDISQPLYTTGNSAQSEAPPAFRDIATANARFWGISGEDLAEVWFTKVQQKALAPEWNANFTLRLPEGNADLTAITNVDEKIVLFTETEIYVVYGEGPNDNGLGSFVGPQQVAADVGCINKNSVVKGPFGVLFQSDKGIYQLDRSLQVSYVGAKVEDLLLVVPISGSPFNTLITSAVLVEKVNQVRFTLNTTQNVVHTLVYDYFDDAWTTFEYADQASRILDGAVWRGEYTYYGADETFHVDDRENYDDDSVDYDTRVVTAWYKMAGIQGYKRVRKATFLGQHSTGNIQIDVDYNYDTALTSTHSWLQAAVPAGTATQLTVQLNPQKLEAVRFTITNGLPGLGAISSGAGLLSTAVDMEVALKSGTFKLPEGSKR